MTEFFQRYFVDPVYQGTGYNVVNTAVYGILLGVGIILAYKLVEKLNVKVNLEFFEALIPFLILGSFLRALEDASIVPKSAFFITPGIFLMMFSLVLLSLALALFFQSNLGIRYHKIMAFIGVSLLVYPLFIFFESVYIYRPFLYIAALFAVSFGAAIAGVKFLNIEFLRNSWVYAVFAAHLFDSSATFVGVELYGYWEEHIFEAALIDAAGTALVLFPFKIAVVTLVVFIIQKFLKGKERNFWYFALFVLGFSPGLRDALKIMLLG